jgi:hypothetical protein
MERIEHVAPLQLWRSVEMPNGMGYVVIDGPAADAIRAAAMMGQWLEGRRGFGSAKVHVTVGETAWKTSVFPHKESGGWFLPIKALVRKAEDLAEGDPVHLAVAL